MVTQVFRPGRAKLLGMAAGSALLAWGGWSMTYSGGDQATKGYVGLVFFVTCCVVFLAQLLPGCSYLRLDSRGFTTSSMWRLTHYPWSKIRRFGVAEIPLMDGTRRLVGFELERRADEPLPGSLTGFNRSMVAGFDSALPDNFGHEPEVLEDLMTRYLKESRTSS